MTTSSLQNPLRVGVIGCGFFGGLHAAKYAAAPAAQLVGVTDIDAAAAQGVASDTDTRAFSGPDDLIGQVDAVSITAPASVHYDLAARFLKAGIHVLVEKPLALSLAHADELIGLAEDGLAEGRGLVLQVGHQERFVFEQFGVLARDKAPRAIRSLRAGPFTGRAGDVSAVFDLMIHDLDLIHQVASADVVDLEVSSRRTHTDHADEVDARFALADGCRVEVIASRARQSRERQMRLEYDDGVIEIDFVNRTLKNTTPACLTSLFDDQNTDERMADPLGYGVRAFVDAVRAGTPPLISGRDSRPALKTALLISDRLAA